MDFCVGHPNAQEYHYHFHAYGNYDKGRDFDLLEIEILFLGKI